MWFIVLMLGSPFLILWIVVSRLVILMWGVWGARNDKFWNGVDVSPPVIVNKANKVVINWMGEMS